MNNAYWDGSSLRRRRGEHSRNYQRTSADYQREKSSLKQSSESRPERQTESRSKSYKKPATNVDDDKSAKERICETCKTNSDKPTARCDWCLLWFHSRCEKVPDERPRHWYCSKCLKQFEDLEKAHADKSTDEEKIADETYSNVSSEEKSADEEKSVDESNSWGVECISDLCRACQISSYNGEEPMILCDRCGSLYHFFCQGIPYDEEVEKWQCSICDEVLTESEKVSNAFESKETQTEISEPEFLNKGLMSVTDFLDHLVNEVGPIEEPTFRAQLELCKVKIETVLKKSSIGKRIFSQKF